MPNDLFKTVTADQFADLIAYLTTLKQKKGNGHPRIPSEISQIPKPIRLVPFETIRDWKAFDADTGKDMAVEIREYFIPDFTNWKDHDAFEATYQRLMKDFKPAPDDK